MSDLLGTIGDNHKSTANAQLATPVLSPISEHGGDGIQPFPLYDVGDEKQIDGTQDNETDQNTRPPVQTNGSVSHGSRRSSTTAKLSPVQLKEFVSSPENLPVRPLKEPEEDIPSLNGALQGQDVGLGVRGISPFIDSTAESSDQYASSIATRVIPEMKSHTITPTAAASARPAKVSRSASSPLINRKQSSSKVPRSKPPPLIELDGSPLLQDGGLKSPSHAEPQASPMPALIPVPPLSFPTYLQLELSSERPSALYIHRSTINDFPYESAKVKFDRLKNFLFIPPQLEQVLWFGAFACLDAWLYSFTILPLRFIKAIAILSQWGAQSAAREVQDVATFVYSGVGRVWQRRRESSVSGSRRPSVSEGDRSRQPSVLDVGSDGANRTQDPPAATHSGKKRKTTTRFRHRRTKSTPSMLLPNHKADILQGLLIAASCTILMSFDASRMYHSIRGQAAIKLYVIYNVLEVFDRLFSALGQDILECLFSKETLERNENGRSKIFTPLWMFLLALAYNVIHAAALFYQVITLNVAVNSYSNALLTLLLSNQFVEIKGTVFKKFERENLFQLTCADVVERFQLWLMLSIIAIRNIVEVGGISISINSALGGTSATDPLTASTGVPLTSGFVIPKSFTIFPKWTGELFGPFLIVLGSEALVDWCKHAYITKFNNVKPNIYGRFFDVLAKDYYTHAFSDQNLTKRLGLPVIPLSCLFIRAALQAYHMFLATHVPIPIVSAATSVSVDSEPTSSSRATTVALQHIDHVFRRALGRSSFGSGSDLGSAFSWWSLDDLIAFAAMIFFFLTLWLLLLAFKLLVGMALLSIARSRYKGMKDREREGVDAHGKRIGGWGVVEVNEDKRRWIYEDDPDGLRELRERDDKGRRKGDLKLDSVQRYSMAAKRIW